MLPVRSNQPVTTLQPHSAPAKRPRRPQSSAQAACGAPNQLCCADNTCQTGASCVSGVCRLSRLGLQALGERCAALTRAPPLASLAGMSEQTRDLVRFLRSLRAVREYTSEPISDDVVNDILEVGRWSGSSSNRQPVELVVVRDAAMKQKISENGVRPAAGAAVAFVVVTPGNPDQRDIEAFDDGRLVERLLLAAKAHGLGANIGTLKGDGPEVIKEALGIPPERRARSVVTMGHIDEAARRARPPSPTAGRKPLSEFAHWDRY
jgi:nitroreductase